MNAGSPRTALAWPQTAWPALPDTVDSSQMVAIARMIERVCGTEAAVNYLADAVTVLRKRWRPLQQMCTREDREPISIAIHLHDRKVMAADC